MTQDLRGFWVSRKCEHRCIREIMRIDIANSACCACSRIPKELWCETCKKQEGWKVKEK